MHMSTTASVLTALIAVISAATPRVEARRSDSVTGGLVFIATQDKEQSKEKGPEVSDGERKLAAKINAAPDAAAKMQAAGEFIKKYPKSSLRPQIVGFLSNQIASVADNAQKIALAENFQRLFTEAGDAQLITPVLIDAYIATKRIDDAFRLSDTWLQKDPDDVGVLAVLAITGTNEAKLNNPKFVQQSQQYGFKAIELIEANKKPAHMDDAQWSKNKATWLPQLYHSTGYIALVSGAARADALARLQKAVALDPADPVNYVLIGNIKNAEYEEMAKQYQGTAAGATRDAMLPKINAQLDEVIDIYAHSVALLQGKPEYKQAHDQVMSDLQAYYKYRHNNSTDGLQQLIDKYKAPSPQPKP